MNAVQEQQPAIPAQDVWQAYEQRKAQFLRDHPTATADELEAFRRQLAEELGL
jgi:hypothetical protein